MTVLYCGDWHQAVGEAIALCMQWSVAGGAGAPVLELLCDGEWWDHHRQRELRARPAGPGSPRPPGDRRLSDRSSTH